MRGVAAVDPALLHLDAVPLARGVDDAGGVFARLLVPRRLVPGEVARRAGLLEQGVFVQAAVVAVLRQSGEHRDPRLRLPEGDGEAVRRGELRCLRVRHAVERARGIGRGKVAVPVERGGDGRARRRLGRLPRLVVPELDHVVIEPVGAGVGDGRGLPVAVAVHGRALVAHRARRARHARLLQRERAVRLEQVFAAVALVHARLHIAVLERAAQRVVAAVFGGGGDGHVLGVKIVQHDGHGRPVRARHVRPGVLARAGGARLQRQLHAHVLKLGLERRRVPHLRGRDAHGIRDAVGERAAVVEERIPLLARRRAVAGGQRVGHGGRAVRLLRDRAEHLLIVAQALALAHVLAHAVDVAEAVRVVLGQLDGLSVLLKQDGAAIPGQRGLHHAPAGEHGRGRAGLLPLAVAPQLQGALRAQRRRGGAGEAEAGEQLLRQAQVRAAVDRDVQHGIEPRAGRGPQPVPVAKVQKDQRRVRHRRRAGRDEPLRQGGERLRKRRAGSALRQRRLQRVRRNGRCTVPAVRRCGRCAVPAGRGRCAAGFVSIITIRRGRGRPVPGRGGRCAGFAIRRRGHRHDLQLLRVRRGRGRRVRHFHGHGSAAPLRAARSRRYAGRQQQGKRQQQRQTAPVSRIIPHHAPYPPPHTLCAAPLCRGKPT